MSTTEGGAFEEALGFQELLDTVPVLVWTAQGDGAVDYVNARWTDYTGLPFGQSMGWRWLDVVHPDDLERTRDVWEVAIAKRTALEVQLRFRSNDGAYRWHLIRAIPTAGKPGWVGSSFDIDRQKRVEHALELLAKANDALSSTLDVRATLERLCGLCVPEVADWCALHLNDNGRPLLAAVHPAGRAPGDDLPVADVLRTGKPIVVRDLALQGREMRELALFPMKSGEQIVGTLALAMDAGGTRTFSGLDLRFCGLLANRAAMGLANAALFEREHGAANLLQRALLPPALPAIDGFALEACYVTGEAMRSVGGDWYDAFVLDDRRLLLSIGDVAGKGLAAATTMGRVRDSLRAAALCSNDPVRILEIADDALRGDQSVFVTCFVALLDRSTRALRYSSAGHYAPRLRAAGGRVRELKLDCGLPLGLQWAGKREKRPAGEVALEPGSLLLLFTDGLIEQTRNPIEDLDRLDAAFATVAAQGAAVALRDAFVTPPSVDDVAILTLSVE